ncbi:MAG: hypothetical protein K0Q87_4709 [Neobacillus sp.]|jgi:hypothetical protein|nr:hypothetical protein [Neobacillus sp.]
MKHNLKISVSKHPQSGGFVTCRNVTIRERFLRFLLGEKQKLTILVPGDTVQELAISEIKEGGLNHEQNQATS